MSIFGERHKCICGHARYLHAVPLWGPWGHFLEDRCPCTRYQFGRLKAIIVFSSLAFLFLAAPARADHRGLAHRIEWTARQAFIIGPVVADGYTTCQGFKRGLVESSAIGKGSRSCAVTISVLAAGTGAYELLNYASERVLRHDPKPAWRFAGRWQAPAIVSVFHIRAAVHNAGVR